MILVKRWCGFPIKLLGLAFWCQAELQKQEHQIYTISPRFSIRYTSHYFALMKNQIWNCPEWLKNQWLVAGELVWGWPFGYNGILPTKSLNTFSDYSQAVLDIGSVWKGAGNWKKGQPLRRSRSLPASRRVCQGGPDFFAVRWKKTMGLFGWHGFGWMMRYTSNRTDSFIFKKRMPTSPNKMGMVRYGQFFLAAWMFDPKNRWFWSVTSYLLKTYLHNREWCRVILPRFRSAYLRPLSNPSFLWNRQACNMIHLKERLKKPSSLRHGVVVLLPLPPGPHEGGTFTTGNGRGNHWGSKQRCGDSILAMESHIGAPFCDGERCMKPTTKMGREW